MNDEDLGLINEFVVESMDLLDEAEPKLISLQTANDNAGDVDPELINSIFRLFHSMKGTAGMLPLNNIAKLTHEAETLLDLFRKGAAVFRPLHTDVLLKAMDQIRKMLEYVEQNLVDDGFEEPVKELVAELSQIIQAETTGGQVEESVEASSSDTDHEIIPNDAGTPEMIEPDMDIPVTKEMIEKFALESDETLEQFEQSLLRLEKEHDEEVLQLAFRDIHSYKGNCSFMGLGDLEKLAHRMENVLEEMKAGTLKLAKEQTEKMLHWSDVLRETTADLNREGTGRVEKLDMYLYELDAIITETAVSKESAPMPEKPVTENQPVAERKPSMKAENRKSNKASEVKPTNGGNGKSIATSEGEKIKNVQQMVSKQIVRQDIRVDLMKLDNLINLVGELVISEAMMTRHPAIQTLKDEGVEKAIHQLRRVSQELQDVAMAVRMVPLAATFQKMIRLVHDLSNKSGKKIDLKLLGEDTEVDKTVIEKIADPLVHIVRNAIDHGIEPPEDRKEKGKNLMGSVTIEGRHEGGEVWILISDDGKGLDRDKILKKAKEKNIIQNDGEELSDKQVYKLIFEPGFSTADKVTDISGRGVGMDVVKKNIEKLKGRVDLNSWLGKGSTFIMRIPLTLAIIDGMLVRMGGARYTVPMLLIRESFRPQPSQIIVTPDGKELVKVREEIIPVIRLHEVFNKNSDVTNLTEGILIIIEVEGQTVCLFIDEILGQQETVIKGLSEYLGSARGISGCTILGDGEVSMILDVSEIISMAKVDLETNRPLVTAN